MKGLEVGDTCVVAHGAHKGALVRIEETAQLTVKGAPTNLPIYRAQRPDVVSDDRSGWYTSNMLTRVNYKMGDATWGRHIQRIRAEPEEDI